MQVPLLSVAVQVRVSTSVLLGQVSYVLPECHSGSCEMARRCKCEGTPLTGAPLMQCKVPDRWFKSYRYLLCLPHLSIILCCQLGLRRGLLNCLTCEVLTWFLTYLEPVEFNFKGVHARH